MTRRGVEEKSRIISASCTKDMKSSSFRHEIGNWEWMKSCWRWHKRRICESAKNVSWKCHILQQNYQRTIYLYLSWGSDGLYIWHYKSITIKLLWPNNPLSYRHSLLMLGYKYDRNLLFKIITHSLSKQNPLQWNLLNQKCLFGFLRFITSSNSSIIIYLHLE